VHIPLWMWFASVILLSWGLVGLLQKLSTDCLSAESSLVWLVVGFQLLQPFVYRSAVFHHSPRSVAWGILSGFLNAVGAWALLAAMKSGGKASIVVTLTALYPLVVIPLVPVLFHESISLSQAVGIACALGAVVLLSVPTPPASRKSGMSPQRARRRLT